jgi:4-carboxymuconolactone decarboxylase
MMRSLDPRTRVLAELSGALPGGRMAEIERALESAAEVAEPVTVEEILLQAYLFVGFPTVLNAMTVWRGLSDGPAVEEEGIGDLAMWRRRGESLCARVYGPAYERLRRNVERLHPALDRWMVEEGYGKVLSRSATDEVTRELCIVALLGAANHERQLHSHLLGALNLGARPESVEEALEVGLARIGGPEDANRLRALWQRVRSSRCSSTSPASG